MIPKTIHFCWFGCNPKPELICKCIESWSKFCPDYEIIEWNEYNFDIHINKYVEEAYKNKKWAFVSDFARLWIIYNYGGIYLDTDVLLKNNIDDLRNYDCWLASDDVKYINTGLGFGAVKGHKLIEKIMMEYYKYEFTLTPCINLNTKVIQREISEWQKVDKSQVINNILFIGLHDYGTYAKHYYTATWVDEEAYKKRQQKIEKEEKHRIRSIVKWKVICFLRKPKFISFFERRKGKKSYKIYNFIAYDLTTYGISYFIKRIFKK